jgi:acyl carrier protein
MACVNTLSSQGDCSGFEKENYMDDTRETIRHLLRQTLRKNNDTRGFGDTDSLILSGRFQSLDVLEIVIFLEDRFGIDFSDGLDQSQLDSVDEIMNFLGAAAK